MAGSRIQLGVSACLLGERVRYDGGHKRCSFIADVLVQHIEYVSICPEAGIGLGTPRPALQLVGKPGQIRALGREDPGLDVTDRLQNYARRQRLSLTNISGYIFKQYSPSCGLREVSLFNQPGQTVQRKGVGVFAAILQQEMPLLPVAEEVCFENPNQTDNFITRIHVYHRWQSLLASDLTTEKLLAFHANHTRLVMAHSQTAERRLRQLLAKPSAYIAELMQTLKSAAQKTQTYHVDLHPYPRSLSPLL